MALYIVNIILPNIFWSTSWWNTWETWHLKQNWVHNGRLQHQYFPCWVFELCSWFFILSYQLFTPTINKATRIYSNSSNLIDRIFTSKIDVEITSGYILSDISNHYSQFCVSHSFFQERSSRKQLRRNFSYFSEALLVRHSPAKLFLVTRLVILYFRTSITR